MNIGKDAMEAAGSLEYHSLAFSYKVVGKREPHKFLSKGGLSAVINLGKLIPHMYFMPCVFEASIHLLKLWLHGWTLIG